MLALLSPAKSLSFITKIPEIKSSIPVFLPQSQILIDKLKKLSILEIERLMKISPKLAKLNWQRFQEFSLPFDSQNAKPALFFFDGDVYKSMEITNYNKQDLDFANQHLHILSGLYGIIKPFDLIQPYRLEMGVNLKSILGQNLYQFWQNKLTDFLNYELKKQQEKIIINLASKEYFSVINKDNIDGKIINIVFKERIGNSYKIIGTFAKKARGLMADFMIKNKIKDSSNFKNFKINGYIFNHEFSSVNEFCFCR